MLQHFFCSSLTNSSASVSPVRNNRLLKMIICKDIFCSHEIKQKQHRRVHLSYLSTSICLQPNQNTCTFYMSLRFMRCNHFFIKVSKKVIVYFCVCTWHPDLVTGLLHLNIKDIVQLPFSKKIRRSTIQIQWKTALRTPT